jgi:hypothetical protein
VLVGRFVVGFPVFVVEVEVVPVEVVAAGGGGQDSDTTAAPAGNDNVDNDTPCGTCNVNDDLPSSLTVTVHCAAEAAGKTATPNEAAAINATATPLPFSTQLLCLSDLM